MSSSDSSFSSSFFCSSFGASGAAPPVTTAAGAAPTAGAPPPAPTFDNNSFTFFPSNAFARSDAQMGSRSTEAALVSAIILSDVISIPSSARMRAAYVAARSTEAIGIGGDNGFNQAIELSAEVLQNVKFIQEKKLIGAFFEEISQDTSKYCFGVEDTLKALDIGAVQTLIVWENLETMRYQFKNPSTNAITVMHLNKDQEKDQSVFKDSETGVELEVVEALSLVEWFANNYKNFGATLEFVTNRSQEGSQFCKGFGGIGGVLRYKVDLLALNEYDNQEDINGSSDEDL